MSPGLKAAKALVDAAVEYEHSVLNNKDEVIEKVVKAVNSVLTDSTKYQNEGIRLKSYVEVYVNKIV